MKKKKIYSWDLLYWIDDNLPDEIKEAMNKVGWNALGVYELVKEGIVLEKKGNISNNPTRRLS